MPPARPAVVSLDGLAAAEDGVVVLQFHELRRSVELLGQDQPPDVGEIGNQVTRIAERYRTEDARGQHRRRRGTNGVANRAQNRFVHVHSPWFAIGQYGDELDQMAERHAQVCDEAGIGDTNGAAGGTKMCARRQAAQIPGFGRVTTSASWRCRVRQRRWPRGLPSYICRNSGA
jgi:hypothetical protein